MDKKNIEQIYALSPAQQGMLYDTVRTAGSGIYIEQLVCSVRGALQLPHFMHAWQAMVDRHALLRTCFAWENQSEPVQVVLRHVEALWVQQDWRHFSLQEQGEKLKGYLEQERRQGFRLSRAPLMRLSLFQVGEDKYEFVWTYHHILMDGWCRFRVLEEALTCYQAFCSGQKPHLGKIRTYREYVAWLKQQDLVKAEQFWRETLQGFHAPTPLGRISPQGEAPFQEQEGFASCTLTLSKVLSDVLKKNIHLQRVTLNTLLQGTWALLLSRYSDHDDVVFGITLSGRPAEMPDADKVVGLCITTLPVRVRVLPHEEAWSWLRSLQSYNVEMRQYEYSPLGSVRQWSDVPGSLPMYESLLVVENYPMDLSILQHQSMNIAFTNVRSYGAQTKYALNVLAIMGERIELVCVYDKRRFTQSSATQLLEHWQQLLEKCGYSERIQLQDLQAIVREQDIPIARNLHKQLGSDYAAPRNALETMVSEIFGDLLGITNMGIHDNFFERGGHSLLATQLISRVQTCFQIRLPLRTIFEAPTIAQLTECIAEKMGVTERTSMPALIACNRRQFLPLSFAQERLWFMHQIYPGLTSYTISRPFSLQGKLQYTALRQSVEEIVRRHEVLRTNFVLAGEVPSQAIHAPGNVPIPIIDLQQIDATRKKEYALQYIYTAISQPFDLAHDPLLRVSLIQLNAGEWILLLAVHHIIFDAWSESIFIRELMALYEAFSRQQPSPLPDLSIQYADFAAWQRQWLRAERLKELVSYWKKQLYGAPLLQLPMVEADQISSHKPGQGAAVTFQLSTELSRGLVALSREEGVTPFMTLLAAFSTLLHRLSSQDDIVLGTDIANRTQTELEALIGFFVNVLALRIHLTGNPSFRVLLERVREVVLGAYTHQDLPFEKLVEAVQQERDLHKTPLIRAIFVLQNTPMQALQLEGLTIRPLEIDLKTTNFDLAVFMWEDSQKLMGGVNYNANLFQADVIHRLIERFSALLQSIVLQRDLPISLLEMRTETEKQQESTGKMIGLQKLKMARRQEITGIVPSSGDKSG